MTVRQFLLAASVVVGLGLVGFRSRPVAPPPTTEPAPTARAEPLASSPSPSADPEPVAADDPSQAMGDVEALEAELAAFVAGSLAVDVPAGSTPEEEDALRDEARRVHLAEARRLEEAYRDVMSFGGDPRATVLALIAVADCKDALAEDLVQAPVPSYLSEDEADAWREVASAEAELLSASAQDARDRAETFAPDP